MTPGVLSDRKTRLRMGFVTGFVADVVNIEAIPTWPTLLLYRPNYRYVIGGSTEITISVLSQTALLPDVLTHIKLIT